MGTYAPWFQSFAGASDVNILRPCGAPVATVHHFRSEVRSQATLPGPTQRP
jgi:hypothetical protein